MLRETSEMAHVKHFLARGLALVVTFVMTSGRESWLGGTVLQESIAEPESLPA